MIGIMPIRTILILLLLLVGIRLRVLLLLGDTTSTDMSSAVSQALQRKKPPPKRGVFLFVLDECVAVTVRPRLLRRLLVQE